MDKDPMHLGSDADQKYLSKPRRRGCPRQRTRRRSEFVRPTQGRRRSGVAASLPDGFTSRISVYATSRSSGPQVGASVLRRQALLATAYSLAGMLIYLGLPLRVIYGVAAVVTVFTTR